jgi:hypothetical protein
MKVHPRKGGNLVFFVPTVGGAIAAGYTGGLL